MTALHERTPERNPMTRQKNGRSPRASVVWFRRDLRLADNAALLDAAKNNAVIPVFVWSPKEEEDAGHGAASRWWLHHSLLRLQAALEAKGSRLIVRCGDPVAEILDVIRQTRATAVHFNRLYEPVWQAMDARLARHLRSERVELKTYNASLLLEPREVSNRSGGPFQVFTPFWRQCIEQLSPVPPAPSPSTLHPPTRWPRSLRVEDLDLLPKVDWATEFRPTWQPGEVQALSRLKRFMARRVARYEKDRDFPAEPGTSRLSPHLHFGEISPRQILHAARKHGKMADAFVRQLGWREFAHHILHHFPRTPHRPLRGEFEAFPWARDRQRLKAWQKGLTGYPIVDAGMRELWTTGWMHNRVRMIAASFLVKDLLIPWQDGAAWFRDTLVDGDLANNTFGWQWSAGCGADAAPYFRIFNPVLQGRKFDPGGKYVRRWIPELAALPDRWLHEPFEAPSGTLQQAGIKLGETYPKPIVNHDEARDRALEAYAFTRNRSARL